MSTWIDRIVQEFPVDLSRFWIVCDPDNVLLEERVLSRLRAQEFEVLSFEDSIAFRNEYEERYRAPWDQGKTGASKSLILQLRGTDANVLPWDFLVTGRKVSLGLADLFPNLSYSVVCKIDSAFYPALFEAHQRFSNIPLGDNSTREFILTHVFRISPHILDRAEDFWREVLRLHHRGSEIPFELGLYVESILREAVIGNLPIAKLLSSRSFALQFVQNAWEIYVDEHFIEKSSSIANNVKSTPLMAAVPFELSDIRAYINLMFIEGLLQPLAVEKLREVTPDWVKMGIINSDHTLADFVRDGAKRLYSEVPGSNASYRDWLDFTCRYGEVVFRFHRLPRVDADGLAILVEQLQGRADESLRNWLFQHYADLPSLPAIRGPVMVHHIPRFLAQRRNAGEERVAVIVFDGLSMDQWAQITEYVSEKMKDIYVRNGACFAWLPTLTSVSRQALFSGLKPREFSRSIETTSQERSLWLKYWQDNDLRKSQVFYQKSIKRNEHLIGLEEAISNPAVQVAGVVVDMVDEMVHGATLGKRGISHLIADWCESGFVEKLFRVFLKFGYHLYISSDHGNVDAEGSGHISEGALTEIAGERVRVYRSENFIDQSLADHHGDRLDLAGLPNGFLPWYAKSGKAFVTEGLSVVSHGGISVEELIVPFAKIEISGKI